MRGSGAAGRPTSFLLQSQALGQARIESILSLPSRPSGDPATAGFPLAGAMLQVDITNPPVSDGQFVWGPNVGRFDIGDFLQRRGSPLAPYASDLALWASYTSVNPKLLLAALEFRSGLVTAIPSGWTKDDVLSEIEDTSMTMALAFYQHLYTWGDRRPSGAAQPKDPPRIVLADGTPMQLDRSLPSGSFALAALVADRSGTGAFQAAMDSGGAGSFAAAFGAMFPSVDLQDTSNAIDPPGTPPANMLMFPFAMGATWTFGGPHSWNGDSTPPFSSMDFFTGGATCSAPPYLFAVSAAAGTTTRPSNYSCWLEINHGGGWVTSYYHLQNLLPPPSVDRNAPLGTIACETCAGG
ncbi:MAG TPA: hypothetical protein VK449_02800, partial [Anaerolineales bacterium]|nr:hypothetical protein [Anaerolineales bacterium]